MKTVVIGLDAATWTVLDSLVDQGCLPHIETLITDGISGNLESTTPPMTPLAWTTMSTGVNPGRHGIFDFLDQDRSTYDISPVDYGKMRRPAVWDVLNMEGHSVGVVNFPLAHPPRAVDPFFISGIPTDVEQTISNSSAIQERLEQSDYRVHPSVNPGDGIDPYIKEVLSLVECRCELTLDLIEEYELDLLWTVFMGTDWVQHYAWQDDITAESAIGRVYRRIDKFVGKLRSVVGDDVNVLLVSDHGAKRIEGEMHMNSLLERWGYLHRAEESAGGPVKKIKDSVLSLGWKVGRTVPPYIKHMVKNVLSDGTIEEMESAVGYGQQNMVSSIDWPETDAFSYGYMGRVFLHDEQSYPSGTLSSTELDELKDELVERLMVLQHPETGDRIVEDVLRKEEVYDGPTVANAPDLLVIPTDWQYMIYGDFGDEWINAPSLRIADHDPEGVLIGAGPDINSGSVNASIADIAPTILSLHDLPILEGMDGRWLDELVSDPDPPDTVPDDMYMPEQSYGVADSEMVTERLEDLGYM